MIYDALSEYYDALVKDEEATAEWVTFTERYASGSNILELASGSGEISLALLDKGYQILATDLSEAMLHKASMKSQGKLETKVMDMRSWSVDQQFDTVLCYCDSVNYLNNLAEFKETAQAVYAHLKPQGVFLFDMHTQERLEEFAEEYIEEGYLDEVPYQWTIQSDEDKIYQHFSFWEGSKILEEHHVQTVFDAAMTETMLKEVGFEVKILTDFNKPGIVPGEKLFYIGRKV